MIDDGPIPTRIRMTCCDHCGYTWQARFNRIEPSEKDSPAITQCPHCYVIFERLGARTWLEHLGS